jgi:hypothetical protein
MTKIAQFASLLAIAFLMLPIAAHAQATRTWISGIGDDANPCSRTAPCKTIAGAISKTSPSGEINVLDPGGFGAVTITKAITIRSDSFTGGVLVSGTNGIVVAAGASDVVQLVGLDIDGIGPSGSPGLAGIQFNSGAALIVSRCHIYGFQAATGAGSGINFQPTGASKLVVMDSIISNNGSTGGAIGASGNVLIQPQSGGSATAQFDRVQLLNGFNWGLRADGTVSGAGATNVELHNVVADGGGNAGFVAAATSATGGAVVNMLLDTVTASNNAGYGVHSVGSNATIRLTGSTITNNGIGLGSGSSGVLASYSNNNVSGNTTDGAPTTTILPK